MLIDTKTMQESQVKQSGRFAVVVGIDDYTESGIGNLRYCTSDAETFYEALLTYCKYEPEKVVLFSNGDHSAAKKPTRSDILYEIHNMCQLAAEGDSILLFFAGHGTRDDKDSYLLTQDYRPKILADSGISMTLINQYFAESKARFKMRFFDACHSGRMGGRSLFRNLDVQEHLLVNADGWMTLSACTEKQRAYEVPDFEHGIFSYFLVKGLSGEAATDQLKVTLDSLRLYVFEQMTKFTEKRGYDQTPVSAGEQAGILVLASSPQVNQTELAPSLAKVEAMSISQTDPIPSQIPNIIQRIRSTLENGMDQYDTIASSHEQKLAFGRELVKKICDWFNSQIREHEESLNGVASIKAEISSIKSCPSNSQLAQGLTETNIASAIEYRFDYETKRIRDYTLSFFSAISPPTYRTEEVLSGVSERDAYYASAVKILLRPKKMFPVCAVIIAIVPATFGLYYLCYSCSTKLGREQQEYWDHTTFLVRTFHAISLNDEGSARILKGLEDVYTQLFVLFQERCEARHLYIQGIGVSGEELEAIFTH